MILTGKECCRSFVGLSMQARADCVCPELKKINRKVDS